MRTAMGDVAAGQAVSPYANQVITKRPSWNYLTVLDVLLNNLSLGLFIVTTLGLIVAPLAFQSLTPVAYPLALLLLVADLLLLVSDLGDPWRFYHMLRVFKLSSPMSVGTWSLSFYGMCLALPAVMGVLAWPIFGGIRQLIPAPLWSGLTLLATTLAVLGLIPAVGGVLYKGVLFSATSQPGWKAARWLGGYIANSAVLLGCALLLVVAAFAGQSAAAAVLRTAMLGLLVLDVILFLLLYREIAPVFKTRYGPNQKLFFWLTLVAAGWVLPFFLLLQGEFIELAPPVLLVLSALVVRSVIVYLPAKPEVERRDRHPAS